MEEYYDCVKDIMKRYKTIISGQDEYYKYTETNITKNPTISEVIEMVEKQLEIHPRNMTKILDSIPEEDIQNYLRAKKLNKIKNGR